MGGSPSVMRWIRRLTIRGGAGEARGSLAQDLAEREVSRGLKAGAFNFFQRITP